MRLIGLLWILQAESSKTNRVILLEEPELSLHTAIIRQLPTIFSRAVKRGGPQVILSTHSHELLADPGLGLDEVLVLEPGEEGTKAESAAGIEGIADLLRAGLRLDEIIEPMTRPEGSRRLPL